MAFKFRSPDQLSSVSYEGVKILANSPKNPKDFQAIQDIIRYREVRLMEELYGNIRLNIHGVTPTNPFTIVNNVVNVNGVWYLDGYRIELDNIISNTFTNPASTSSYALMLDIRFDTIDYTSDFSDASSIALKDPVTGKYIETSQRLKFSYRIRFASEYKEASTVNADGTITDVVDGPVDLAKSYDTTYYLATGVYTVTSTGGSWSFKDMSTGYSYIKVISLTFADAVARAENSIQEGQSIIAHLDYICQDGYVYWTDADGRLRVKKESLFDITVDTTSTVGGSTSDKGGTYVIPSDVLIDGQTSLAHLPYLVQNGFVYWTDLEGKLRVKKESSFSITGDVINNGTEIPVGKTLTDTGGMYAGANPTYSNIIDASKTGIISTSVDKTFYVSNNLNVPQFVILNINPQEGQDSVQLSLSVDLLLNIVFTHVIHYPDDMPAQGFDGQLVYIDPQEVFSRWDAASSQWIYYTPTKDQVVNLCSCSAGNLANYTPNLHTTFFLPAGCSFRYTIKSPSDKSFASNIKMVS